MDRELLAGITISRLTYFFGMVLVGVALALVARLVTGKLKRRLRVRSRTSLPSHLVEDVDGAISLWILMAGIYLGLLGMPPLAGHLSTMRHVFTVASIAVVVYAAIRLQGDMIAWYIRRIGRKTGQTKVLNSLVPVGKRVVSIAILAMGVLIILDQLGISIAPLVAGLGIGGLAVALALQNTLTNFFAGLNVLTDGSIRIGDFVELENGLRGEVEQIGWRTTRIRMLANNTIIMPNSKLADNIATNYSYPIDELSVYVEVGVSYFSDLDHVERVTLEVARKVLAETEGSVKDYEPTVWYLSFGDSNINFWVVLRAHGYRESWLVKHNFIKALFRRYNEEDIEISFPARSVFMRDGAQEMKPSRLLLEPEERSTG